MTTYLKKAKNEEEPKDDLRPSGKTFF